MHIVSLSFFTYIYLKGERRLLQFEDQCKTSLGNIFIAKSIIQPPWFPRIRWASQQIWISNLFLRWKKARRDRNTGKKTFSFISHFFHFDSRIDLPLKVPLSLTQLCLALSLSPPSQPLLQKMACTLGLFSNYGSTFSEKVIIIRDPFSFSVKSTK